MFDPSQLEELIGWTYLTKADEDDNVFCARIVHALDDYDTKLKDDPDCIKFVVELNDKDKTEEIVAYNDIICFVSQEVDHDMSDQFWKFKRISGHQEPLCKGQQGYNDCSWNMQVEWEDGSRTYEPL